MQHCINMLECLPVQRSDGTFGDFEYVVEALRHSKPGQLRLKKQATQLIHWESVDG